MDELVDDLFGTSCQAREGTKIYEGFTSGDEVNIGVTTTTITITTPTVTTTDAAFLQAVTAFDLEACVELPKEASNMKPSFWASNPKPP